MGCEPDPFHFRRVSKMKSTEALFEETAKRVEVRRGGGLFTDCVYHEK